jgi:subtilisin family serine protease
MKEDVLILRSLQPEKNLTPESFPMGGEAAGPMRPFRIERQSVDAGELTDVRQDGDVLAAAEVVPMKLHQPLERRSLATDAVVEEPWGLAAVSVDDTTCSGLGATVAILDTGIDADHEAFASTRDKIVQEDFTGEGLRDDDGHGTHCAGTIFGGVVAGHQIGVAPNLRQALIGKVIGSHGCSSAMLAGAIEWAVGAGANIVSISLGIDYPSYVRRRVESGFPADIATAKALQAYRETLEFFAAIAHRAKYCRRPLLFVAAAGKASRFHENADYVIGVEPPAAASGFLSVAALRRGNRGRYAVAEFSNGGARICAPGVEILSARAGSRAGLAMMSGTSMATPHVAGVAALWMESLTRANCSNRVTSESLLDEILASAKRDRIDPPRVHDSGRGNVRAPIE